MSALPKHLLPTRPQNLQNLFESCRKILYTDKNSAKRMVHMYTKNDVLEFISENDVKFIRPRLLRRLRNTEKPRNPTVSA